MALKIRLRQQGCSNRQTFRVVVTDVRAKRDGKYVEKLGWYLPEMKQNNCTIDADRLAYWLSQGAEMTEQVANLAKVVTPDVIKEYNQKRAEVKAKRTAKRRAVKAEAASEAPKAAAKATAKKTTKKATAKKS
ncbi:MAG: 30S ribosomal protein S16 [Chlamydiae bacterium]|nr:30S ribosomal protein S16 [Chlamydiota bacterium]